MIIFIILIYFPFELLIIAILNLKYMAFYNLFLIPIVLITSTFIEEEKIFIFKQPSSKIKQFSSSLKFIILLKTICRVCRIEKENTLLRLEGLKITEMFTTSYVMQVYVFFSTLLLPSIIYSIEWANFF